MPIGRVYRVCYKLLLLTLNEYSNGESERLVRKAIEKFSIPRNRLVIMVRNRITSAAGAADSMVRVWFL